MKAFTNASWNEALAAVRGGPPTSAFYTGPSPQELHAIYSRGFRALRPETMLSPEVESFAMLVAAMPKLYEAFPWAQGIGKGKLSCPFYAQLHFDPKYGGDEAQTVGSCTVHGLINATAMDYCNDALHGETKYMGRLVKEAAYRSRGYSSHGWSCRAPCRYVSSDGPGGLLYRKVYEGPNGEKVDLSRLNESWASNGRAGVPVWLQEVERQNKVKLMIQITTMEEYRDAIAIGFGINVCSGQGFSSTTDEHGLAEARGSWSHAMAHQACDDTEYSHRHHNEMTGGIQQSWGRWNTQRGKPTGMSAMPVGMFMARSSVIARMIRGGDSFAMCSVFGWDRVGPEAFDVVGLKAHLASSTVQDYYKTRQERGAEFVQKAIDEHLFTAI